jgi:hypothetical protein
MFGYIISDKEEINVEEYEIQSFDILHRTKLNIFVIENKKILYKNDIVYNASRNEHIEVLEWFKNSGYEFEYYEEVINEASINEHIEVLEWFKNSGYEFKYDIWMINYACQYGNIKILEWVKNSGYTFKYNFYAIIWASRFEYVEILEFFKNRNVKKIIKWSGSKFIKTIKYKTKNNYIKGYNKN